MYTKDTKGIALHVINYFIPLSFLILAKGEHHMNKQEEPLKVTESVTNPNDEEPLLLSPPVVIKITKRQQQLLLGL